MVTMRSILALLLTLPLLAAHSQTQQIGIIDFYGLDKITEAQARAALTLKEGDSLNLSESGPPQAVTDSEQALRRIPGVVNGSVNVVCCDQGRLILYVGIEESGRPALKFRPAPTGPARLADDTVALGRQFDEALFAAVTKGNSGEDDSQGHALSTDPVMRVIQERFIEIAKQDYPHLRKVLRTSSVAEQRALAAMIMGYAPDKAQVAADLVDAVNDPDGGVRNNAVRALAIIQQYAFAHPEQNIVIAPQPFVDLLNSSVWTDRNKALFALGFMTDKRDEKLLSLLHDRALKSLVEMAKWKSKGHAIPAVVILGRIGGMTDEAIHKAYEKGDLASIIKSAKS